MYKMKHFTMRELTRSATAKRLGIDNASRYLKEIVPPKVFFFYDTAEGKLYFWNGAALTQK